jgi:hypothetical protein
LRTKSLATLLLLAVSLLAQTTTVFINDTNGNQTIGTISNGNVYFHDTNGNVAFGTIRDGNVFLNTNKGEITFGTIKDGNVFLTDQKGVTTGTIRNGNIFLNNSDGSITSGTYTRSGDVSTTTTGVPNSTQQQQDDARQKQLQQQNYEAGAAIGRGIGAAIAGGIENHHINSFCKDNPTSTYHTSDGIAIDCPKKPLDDWEQAQIDSYCSNNPGSWMAFGKHRVDCLTPPNPPNLKWAKWELNAWQWDYRNPAKAKLALSSEEMRSNWNYWRGVYCGLAESGAPYKDLTGRKHHCPD